jgi:hypothetical protein
MRKHSQALLLVFLALLCGCGGGTGSSDSSGGGGQVNPPVSPPAPLNVQGNWQLTLPMGGEFDPDINIAGSIVQSGTSLTGAVHLDGSDCFDRANTVNLTGTVSDPNLTLTLSEIDGQVVTLTGIVAGNKLTGTFNIQGGCANGKQGAIQGVKIPTLASAWKVNYTQGFFGGATIAQDAATPEGSFSLSGSMGNFQCLSGPVVSGTIVPGTFPSPSHILGKSVLMKVEMDDGGTVNINALASEDGFTIRGFYEYVGGTCDGDANELCFGESIFCSFFF